MEIQLAASAAPEDGAEDAEVRGPARAEATHRRSFRALWWTLKWSACCACWEVQLSRSVGVLRF